MKIIIGLGNPGEKYNKTRHNVGFIALDFLAKKHGLNWQENKKFKANIAKGTDFLLIKPMIFMNNSGISVQSIALYYKLLTKKFGIIKKNMDLSGVLTVVHDDIDIELGQIKKSVNSGSAGHKGVQSIINYLKTKNFNRIRIGIKKRNNKIPVEKFVLQKFNKEELDIINNILYQENWCNKEDCC